LNWIEQLKPKEEPEPQEDYQEEEEFEDEPLMEDNEPPHTLELIMCPPKYLSAKIANNEWMKEMPAEDRVINIEKAMAEFHTMYSLLSQDAMVYLLPPKKGLQDEVYISNAGVVLPHLPKKTMILSNFLAPGRPGEEDQLRTFAEMMEYDLHDCPYKFEGEAELKYITDNIYAGAYGIRTEEESLDWMIDNFDCDIIKIKQSNEWAYHLDCSIFPISGNKIIFAKDLIDSGSRKKLEKIADLIPIGKQEAEYGLTNIVRVGSIIYAGTYIKTLTKDHEEYPLEKNKNELLEKICIDNGLGLVFVQLSEFNKSGAMLSCCILHLNYVKFLDMDK
jgi:N-dimethylarginine dimethylaminohydrolase